VPFFYKAWRPRDSLFDFPVFVRVSKLDFPQFFFSNFKLFKHQTVRSSRVHSISIYKLNCRELYRMCRITLLALLYGSESQTIK
jgi:hypothetical protein